MTQEAVKTKESTAIRASENVSNIAEAISRMQKELKPIKKSGVNKFQNYNYSKFEDFVEGTRDALTNNDLFIISTVSQEPTHLEPRPSGKGGTQYCVEVKVTLRIVHKSGEWMEIDCYGEGQDAGDKAIYKAITGARKYAIQCLLGLSSTDDPEEDSDEDLKELKGKPSNVRYSPPTSHGTNGQARPQNNNKPPRSSGSQPPHDPKTGVLVPPEEGGITFSELMAKMKEAKTVKDLIETFDMRRVVLMTPEQKEEFVTLKDEMKSKVTG